MRRSHAEAIHNTEVPYYYDVPSHEAAPNASRCAEPAPDELVAAIKEAADDAKGIETVVLNVAKNFGLADYFMVLSGRSDRHVQGLANKIIDTLASVGVEPYSVQGIEQGHWVVIDTVDVVIHIFYEPLRDRYDLENLWAPPIAEKTATSKRSDRVLA